MLGVPTTFTVSVTALRNLPLDLYILMDLSFSMSDELDTVKSIADQIGKLGCAPSGFFAQVGGGVGEASTYLCAKRVGSALLIFFLSFIRCSLVEHNLPFIVSLKPHIKYNSQHI